MLEAIWFMIAAALIIIDIRDAIRHFDRAMTYIDQNLFKKWLIEFSKGVFVLMVAGVVYYYSWYEVIGKACG
ncbi:TPA: hypothetical protein NNP44_004564 [Salmonella enterica]|nr:hypothetical protein [Salmonella enterica]HCH8780919.1 hypothetical protein [Salmonella enterica]